MTSTTSVHIVNLSTALRDRLDEEDGDCQMSFSEVANVSTFRVVSASIPLSSYTFSNLNNQFTWGYSISSVYNLDDFLTLRAARWSTFGTNSRVLTYRETVPGVGVRFEKTVTINDIFYTNVNDILNQINVPPAEAPAGVVLWDASTNKLFLDVAATGDAVLVELICDSLAVLGVSPRLATLSIYDGPVIPQVVAQGTVNLQPRVSAVGVPVTWRPDSIEAGFYPPVEVISILQGLFISAGYDLADANTKGLQWVEGVGPMFAKNTNLSWQVVGISPNFARITSMQDNGTLPYTLRNITDPDSSTAVTTGPINVTKTQLSWGPDQVLTFATDQLYLESSLLSALNTAVGFAATGAVWSAAHNRLTLTTGENFKIRFKGNVVLGILTEDWIEVARSSVWNSRTVYDLSGGQDVFYLGLPDLYSHGRTSQGFGANSVRRRDIVLSIANTSTSSFGSYLHYYDQSGLFIPLGRSRSVTTLRMVLYNQRFEPVYTNGIPVHATIELV
jgi:hypothetical protein